MVAPINSLSLLLGLVLVVVLQTSTTAQFIGVEAAPTTLNDNNSDCFNTTDLEVLVACIGNETLLELGCTSGNFEEIFQCANDTINDPNIVDIITTLPDCVESTLVTLGQCTLQNREECSASCAGVTFDGESFTSGVVWNQIVTCPQVQSDVVDPLCGPVSCCPVCVDAFEAFAECLVNDLISFAVPSCDFECTGQQQRRRRRLLDSRDTSEGSVGRSILDCGDKDLTDRRKTIETVGGAVSCATEEYLETLQQVLAPSEMTTAEPGAAPSTAPPSAAVGSSLLSLAFVVGSMLLIGMK